MVITDGDKSNPNLKHTGVTTQTAMKVGLTLAQRRDDSTDVGQTLGQPTLLSGHIQQSLDVTHHSWYKYLKDPLWVHVS